MSDELRAMVCKKGHRFEYIPSDPRASAVANWSRLDERPPAIDVPGGGSAGRLCPTCIIVYLREHFALVEEKPNG